MKVIICCATPERGAEIAQFYPNHDPVTILSRESVQGLTLGAGDVVVVDGYRSLTQSNPPPTFWKVEQWPYILQDLRTLNRIAGNDWNPVFTG